MRQLRAGQALLQQALVLDQDVARRVPPALLAVTLPTTLTQPLALRQLLAVGTAGAHFV